MNDPGLLRMEADPEPLAQEPVCQGQGRFGLLTGLADDDEVVRPPRQPIAGLGHGTIERREEDVRPQRACDPALRDPRRGRLPFPGLDHSCVKRLRIKCRTRPSLISAAIRLTSLSWSIASKKARMSASKIQKLPSLISRHTFRIAMWGERPGRYPNEQSAKWGSKMGAIF